MIGGKHGRDGHLLAAPLGQGGRKEGSKNKTALSQEIRAFCKSVVEMPAFQDYFTMRR